MDGNFEISVGSKITTCSGFSGVASIVWERVHQFLLVGESHLASNHPHGRLPTLFGGKHKVHPERSARQSHVTLPVSCPPVFPNVLPPASSKASEAPSACVES